MVEFTSDLPHMAGVDNVVTDCLSRPPKELSLPRSTQVAGVKVPSGSLATRVARDGSTGASSAAAAVVLATQQGPIRWAELARDQPTCQETQELLISNTGLLVEMVVYQGANLWCDNSTEAIRPLVLAFRRRPIFQQVHQLSHAGQQAMRQLVAACFVQPGLAADVVAWCKECAACNCWKTLPLVPNDRQ